MDNIRNAEIKLTLPMPPSVNAYYGVVPGTQKRYLTKKAKAFRHDVAVIVATAGLRGHFGKSKLAVRVDLNFASGGDCDNRNKPLLDALQESFLYDNDRQIKDLRVVIGHPVKGGRCNVTIWRI